MYFYRLTAMHELDLYDLMVLDWKVARDLSQSKIQFMFEVIQDLVKVGARVHACCNRDNG
jgi:hypothetical protein